LRAVAYCDRFFGKGRYDLVDLRAKIAELLRGQRRAALLKDPKTVVWVPKDFSGYYVITCTNCLRSFPVRGTTEKEHTEEQTPCPHCQRALTYFIEESRP
jgi:hypothetical protein